MLCYLYETTLEGPFQDVDLDWIFMSLIRFVFMAYLPFVGYLKQKSFLLFL